MKNPVFTSLLDLGKAAVGLVSVVIRDLPNVITKLLKRTSCKVEGHDRVYGQSADEWFTYTSVVCRRCEQNLYYKKEGIGLQYKDAAMFREYKNAVEYLDKHSR